MKCQLFTYDRICPFDVRFHHGTQTPYLFADYDSSIHTFSIVQSYLLQSYLYTEGKIRQEMPSTTRVKNYYIRTRRGFTRGHTLMFMLITDTRCSLEPNNVLIYVGFLKFSHAVHMYCICYVVHMLCPNISSKILHYKG